MYIRIYNSFILKRAAFAQYKNQIKQRARMCIITTAARNNAAKIAT